MKLYITTKLILNLLLLNTNPNDEDNSKYIIKNDTQVEYLDEIVRAGLQELDIDKVRIRIVPMDNVTRYKVESRTNQKLDAFITGRGHRYTIYIGSFSRNKYIEVLAHELIHLKQYYSKELQIIENKVIYKDKLYYNANHINYDYRPWENDAYADGKKLNFSIKNRLEL